jgi:hypothetical protein
MTYTASREATFFFMFEVASERQSPNIDVESSQQLRTDAMSLALRQESIAANPPILDMRE